MINHIITLIFSNGGVPDTKSYHMVVENHYIKNKYSSKMTICLDDTEPEHTAIQKPQNLQERAATAHRQRHHMDVIVTATYR